MSTTITHFMWGYQSLFRGDQRFTSERVFRLLDERFDPAVFLVGIRADPNRGRYPACVDPEDDLWISSQDFDRIPAMAAEILSAYPERKMLQTHPQAQQWQNETLFRRSLRDAVLRVIEDHPGRPANLSFWVSIPVKIDCYWVSLALGLQRSVIDSHYTLQKCSIALHAYRNIPISKSLIDAVVEEYLSRVADGLQKPDPGLDLGAIDTEELIRSAGSRLMTGVVWRISNGRTHGTYDLFRDCNTISSLYYEKSVGKGTVVLARREHPAIQSQLALASPIRMGNYRSSRRFLELAFGDCGLHCDTKDIFGLVAVQGYDVAQEDLFQVTVLDHHHWELAHAGNPLMRVRYGHPNLPAPPFDDQKLRVDLPRIFKGITPEEVQGLTDLVKEAEQETHGTMLLISEAAEQEAKRLKTQATLVTPLKMTPRLLKHVTPIDGAILLSPKGMCYAIGAILDGMACEEGDPGRGARFNSALRYVKTSQKPCMAVVVSADGGFDLFPRLRPAIERSSIEEVLSGLQAILQSEPINRRRYGKLIEWMENHRFYLLKEDCDTLNRLVADIGERIHTDDPDTPNIVRLPYMPHPEMNESLYYLPR